MFTDASISMRLYMSLNRKNKLEKRFFKSYFVGPILEADSG
jgi:hypothetical protein